MNPFAERVEAIHARLADPTVQMLVGKAELATNTQLRRIVWLQPSGTIEPVTRSFGKLRSTDRRHELVAALALRVEAHIHAANRDETWALLQRVYAVAARVLGTTARDASVQFDWDGAQPADVGARGEKATLIWVWLVPMPDQTRELTIIEGQEHVCSIETIIGSGSDQ